jgi:seryl-tRNA synthetase
MTDTPNAYVIALHQVQAERDAAQTRAESAEKERDDLAQKLSGKWIEREVDARVMTDAQVSSLRDQLNAMTDARDGAIARADQCEQDAHVTRTNLNTLSAMFRAAISAVVRA